MNQLQPQSRPRRVDHSRPFIDVIKERAARFHPYPTLLVERFETLSRAFFVPDELRDFLNKVDTDEGCAGLLSQPGVIFEMVGRLFLKGSERVFEAGTGTGYQTAILARLCAHVATVELSPERTRAAKTRLDALGITNVTFITGDAAHGAPDLGPFDRMIYGAALSGQVDQHLIDQIAPRGGLLAPIGQYHQETRMIEGDLLEVRKDKEGNVTQKINPIFGGTLTFVPLISRRSIGWTPTKEGGCVPSSDNSNR